jgi:hypothetical protein
VIKLGAGLAPLIYVESHPEYSKQRDVISKFPQTYLDLLSGTSKELRAIFNSAVRLKNYGSVNSDFQGALQLLLLTCDHLFL